MQLVRSIILFLISGYPVSTFWIPSTIFSKPIFAWMLWAFYKYYHAFKKLCSLEGNSLISNAISFVTYRAKDLNLIYFCISIKISYIVSFVFFSFTIIRVR